MQPERDFMHATVFEHSPEPAYVMDPEHNRILAANDAGCTLLGYTRAELLETPISRIHPRALRPHPDDRPQSDPDAAIAMPS